MSDVLNFDALRAKTADITVKGKTFKLQGRCPAEIALQIMGLVNEEAKLPTLESDTAALQSAFADYMEHVKEVTLALFQFSLPDTTEADMDLFTHDERMDILKYFLSLRFEKSLPPTPTSPSSDETTA